MSSNSSHDIYSETLTVFEDRTDPREPLTTPEVAESLDVSRRTVYKRLEKLVDRGDLRTKKAGARARVWWRPPSRKPDDGHVHAPVPPPSELESTVEDVLERISDGFYGLDDELRFTYVNTHAENLLDIAESEVLGRDVREELALTEDFTAAVLEARRTQRPVFLEDYYEPLHAWYDNAIYPSETGLSVYFRDISERKRLERDLRTEREQFRVAIESSPLVAFRLDTDLRYTWVANPHEDFDPDAVIGKRDDELLSPEAAEIVMAPKREALETGARVREEVTYDLPSGRVSYDLTVEPFRAESGEIVGLTAASMDITDLKRRERELEEYRRWNETLVENFPDGVVTLVDEDLRYLTFAGTLRDISNLSRADLEGGLVRDVLPPRIADVVVPGYEAALDGEGSSFEEAIDDRDYQFTFVPVRDDEGHVFAVTAMSRDVTERKRREEQLALLNRLNRIVQQVTYHVIESSTREEIERSICDQLTGSNSYEYAWIGHLDPKKQTVTPQTGVGGGEYPSEFSLSVGRDGSGTGDPFADAVRTREVQLIAGSDGSLGSEHFARSNGDGSRSGAAIPIFFEERVYGVLAVYTSRMQAFDENERHLVGQLGSVIGHAITSIERKRALLEDRIHELTFHTWDLVDAFADATDGASFSLSVERSIPLGDGKTLVYYDIDGIPPEEFVEVTETLSPGASCRVLGQSGTRSRVEVETTELTLASRLSKYDSWITGATFEDGEFRITARVPQHSDVRKVVEEVTETYPNTDVVAQTEVTREKRRLPDAFGTLDDKLTDRQRTTLGVAYYAGYFDWPRGITGEELAQRLNVTPPTAHYHLRKGERKLVASYFDSRDGTGN